MTDNSAETKQMELRLWSSAVKSLAAFTTGPLTCETTHTPVTTEMEDGKWAAAESAVMGRCFLRQRGTLRDTAAEPPVASGLNSK